MLCPYCKKEDFVPEVVFRHTESYGGGNKNFRCIYCGNVVNARCAVKIVITNAKQTDNDSDWG